MINRKLPIFTQFYANEISSTNTLNVNHGGGQYIGSTTKTFDIAGDGKKSATVQGLTTTKEELNIGDMTWSESLVIHIKNKSTSTDEGVYILKDSVDFLLIPAGATVTLFPKPDGTAIEARSATGTPSIEVIAAKLG